MTLVRLLSGCCFGPDAMLFPAWRADGYGRRVMIPATGGVAAAAVFG